MATYIKTLLEYSTGDTIYPKTKSDAVYRTDNVTVAETTLAAADTHIANTNNPHNVTATQLNVYTKTEIDNAGYLTSIPKASSSVLGGIKIGSGLTISSGGVVSVTGGGVADSVAWGHITGTLADQTDLNNILSTIPTNVSDLPNDAGYITGITSSDVTNALGYTPYSSANPNGYTSNIGTITSVKTTAGTHNTINVTSGSVSFNVPTKTSHLNNDSGFITTETDPVFSASAAAGITSSDITNWNTKSFKITVTENNGTYTADKTYAEVESAINAGYICYVTDGTYNYYYTFAFEGYFYFEHNSNWDNTYFYISSDSVLYSSETQFGTAAQNMVFATPPNQNGIPYFRALVANDIPDLSGTYLTSYTETDPVFSASAAAGITSTDITNWNNKVSDDKTWNSVSLTKTSSSTAAAGYVPYVSSTSATSANYYPVAQAGSTDANAIPKYSSAGYLFAYTPSSNDSSTKVATTSFVKTALRALNTAIGELRTDIATAQTDIFELDIHKSNAGQDTYIGASLDDCTTAGWYYIDPSTTTENTPDSFGGILEVIRTGHNDAGAVLQRFTAVNNDGITYMRYDANATGSFTEWQRMG